MNWLGVVGLVLVVLAALVVAVLAVRHRQQGARAAADRPRTVADLVRMRAEAAAAETKPAEIEPAEPKPVEVRAAEVPVPRGSAPVAQWRPPAKPPSPAPSQPPATEPQLPAPRAVPAARRAPAEPAPEPARPWPVAPAPPAVVPAPSEPPPRPPGPDVAGFDTPWLRAAVIASGTGGTGTWEPPVPTPPAVVAPAPAAAGAVPVPLRLVPPGDAEDPDPVPVPDPEWTGWADWAEVDAETAVETDDAEVSAIPAPSPATYEDSEAEHVALPLGRRSPAERAAEQAAADQALLRTFGYGDPDSAPVVSMVRPDVDDVAAGHDEKGVDQPVRFRVVRRDGTAVAGAAVTLLDNRGTEVGTATAGADGSGEVIAPASGDFMLVGAGPGYQPGVTAVTVGDGPADAEVQLVRSASVSGAVHGEDGPIGDARVTLTQDDEVVETVGTDPDGRYRFVEIGSGEYRLTVAAPGWVPAATLLEVDDEAGVEHDITLAPASPTATP